MNPSQWFIERPVATLLLMIAIVLACVGDVIPEQVRNIDRRGDDAEESSRQWAPLLWQGDPERP